jgi:hypothetical protein
MVRGVLAVAPEGTGVTSTGDPGLEPLHWRPDGRDWVGAPFRVVRAAPSRSTVYALERDGRLLAAFHDRLSAMNEAERLWEKEKCARF